MLLAADHVATERLLTDSGVPQVLLGNSFYAELFTGQLSSCLKHGFVGAVGDVEISLAARSDYAEAAAEVLALDRHQGAVYELGGETVTKTGLAEVITAATGRQVSYVNLPADQYQVALEGAGLTARLPYILANIDRGIGLGELQVDNGHLEKLLGRSATPPTEVFADTAAAASQR